MSSVPRVQTALVGSGRGPEARWCPCCPQPDWGGTDCPSHRCACPGFVSDEWLLHRTRGRGRHRATLAGTGSSGPRKFLPPHGRAHAHKPLDLQPDPDECRLRFPGGQASWAPLPTPGPMSPSLSARLQPGAPVVSSTCSRCSLAFASECT